MFVDDTELNIENDGNKNEGEVIDRAQSTLTTWHQALIFTGEQFKLVKLYWIMMAYEWKDRVAKLKQDKCSELHVTIDDNSQSLPYLPSQQSRTLVGVSTNPANDNSLIYSLFQTKLNQYIPAMQTTDLLLSEIWKGYLCF